MPCSSFHSTVLTNDLLAYEYPLIFQAWAREYSVTPSTNFSE